MVHSLLMLSGGADSSAAAHLLRSKMKAFAAVSAVHAANGREIECAKKLCDDLGVEHHVIDFSSMSEILREIGNPAIAMSFGGQIGECGDDPVDQVQLVGSPMSVEILHLSCALVAIAKGIPELIWAIHRDDMTPERNAEWTRAYAVRFEELVHFTTGTRVTLAMPFLDMSKAEVIETGLSVGLDLAATFSCAQPDSYESCGICSQCRKRAAALRCLEVHDPVPVARPAVAA